MNMCTTTQVITVFDDVIHLPYLDIFIIHRGLPTKVNKARVRPQIFNIPLQLRFGGVIAGLGYGDQLNENDSSGSELFNSRSSDRDNNQTNDRFKKDNGYHVVPPPLTGNYMPPLADLSFAGLNDSIYRPTSNKTSASVSSLVELSLKIGNESVKPKQADKPRIITQNPKVDRRDWNGKMTQKLRLGFGFIKKKACLEKACFVCGSYNHLIKDCDFHEKRLANKSVLKDMGKVTILISSGRVPVSAAKQSSLRAAASTGAVKQVNTATHTNRVNVSKLRTNAFHKSHSPIRRSFYKSTALNTRISNENVNTVRVNGVNTTRQTTVSAVKGNGVTAIKASGNPQQALKNKGIFDSGCSRHMTGNKDFLTVYQELDGGFVAFGGSARGGKITLKGKIKADKLDFEDVFFVKELKFNLFSISQMCDKKNSVLFTETECLVLSPDFKLLDESQVLLRVPRQSNKYSFDINNVVPSRDLTCLFAKAIIDESKLWHRRLGHVNFKTMNKLVKGNLVRGLPSKIFDNDHTCVACQKGKQHKASCKAKLMSSISQPLQMLHMDLFGPTSVRSINHKTYCLVVTDDFSRFSWVFFLASKDETSGILKRFITEIENQLNHKVKVIRCDNGTEFKNREMNEFCGLKGIKREFSVARTPQQNGVAERKNKTLIEAARTMLADSLLPTVFWAEAVNTACYVLNRVLVTKPHNKTPYELIIGRPPSISFMRPFGCPVTILNTLDPLGKFDGKAEEGFLVGYSVNSKAFRGQGPNWLFDIDSLTNSMNYQPVTVGNQTNKNAGPQEANDKYDGTRKKAQSIQMLVEKSLKPQCNMGALQRGKTTKSSSTNNFNTFSTPVSFCYRLLMMKLWTLRILLLLIKLWVQRLISTTWNLQLLSVPTSITKYSLIILKIKYLEIQARTNPQNRSSPEMKVGLSNARRSALFLDSEVGTLVDLPYGKRLLVQKWGGIDIIKFLKWGIVFRNKSQAVSTRYKTEEGMIYDEMTSSLFSTKKSLCTDFEQIMHKRFQMSSMGELTFLLGFTRTANTPMETNKALTKDEDGEDVDVHSYRLRVANSTTEAEILLLLNSVVKCFGSKINGRLMVYKCSELYTSANWIEVGSDEDEEKKTNDEKCLMAKASNETSVPQYLEANEVVHKEGDDSVERAITTAASLDAAQDSDNIIRTQTMAMPNVDIPQGMDSGGSPRRQDTIGGAPAQTRSERVLEQPIEPPLSEGHTSRSREGMMEYQFELTDNVLDLEKEKDAQAVEILRLKKRVKRLERQRKSSTSQPRRRKYRQVESSDDDLNEEDASK
ncbi:putative ribonuclease H-like domain-containing protein [Tanacetum coccineum]|uniref:Ribonuclease H-like domain-containing protein n=1 Tax=Tanacetum coccineum TaxID=301880 RepID=A0ABQ4ZX55_9ASTR